MKLAMIANYPVDPEVVPGGVAAVAHTLVQGLVRQPGLEVHVVCCQPDVDRDRTESRDGATVHFLRHSDRFTQILDWAPQRRAIARVIERIRPDVVHAQGLGLSAAAAIDARRPFAVSLHGILWKEASITHPSWVKRLRGSLRARHARRQLLATHNVFITSRYASRMLPAEGRYREFVVNNPVRDELFAIENRPQAPRILFVGGLRHRKDPITAIRAFAATLRKVPDATLRIVGPPSSTPFDREVEEFVKAEGLTGRVAILGLIPDLALRDEWAQASVLLLTSIEETAPVALGEACAVGVPQIGTDAGGIPDLIREGRTGFVRPVGDVDALAERLVAVLTDAPLRESLARQSKELGRTEFSLDAIAAKTAQAYEIIRRGPTA